MSPETLGLKVIVLTITYELARRLQTTLAYAYFKVEHGLQDCSFRLIEPFIIEATGRKRYLSEGSHDARAFFSSTEDFSDADSHAQGDFSTSVISEVTALLPTLNLIAEDAGCNSATPTNSRAISSTQAFEMTQPSLNGSSIGELAPYALHRS